MGLTAAIVGAVSAAGGVVTSEMARRDAKKQAKQQAKEAKRAEEEAERKRLAMTPTTQMGATQRIAAEKAMQQRRAAGQGRSGTVLSKSTNLG